MYEFQNAPRTKHVTNKQSVATIIIYFEANPCQKLSKNKKIAECTRLACLLSFVSLFKQRVLGKFIMMNKFIIVFIPFLDLQVDPARHRPSTIFFCIINPPPPDIHSQ